MDLQSSGANLQSLMIYTSSDKSLFTDLEVRLRGDQHRRVSVAGACAWRCQACKACTFKSVAPQRPRSPLPALQADPDRRHKRVQSCSAAGEQACALQEARSVMATLHNTNPTGARPLHPSAGPTTALNQRISVNTVYARYKGPPTGNGQVRRWQGPDGWQCMDTAPAGTVANQHCRWHRCSR